MRILIVDDDVDLGALLKEYLEAEGFAADVVHNGIEGTDAALSGAYDAVILDIMLPGRGGVEVLQRIRLTSKVPVIMLTAKGDHVDRVIGLEIGADDYVPKPCYPRELVARLRAVLRRTGEGAPQEEDVLRLDRLRVQVPQRKVDWDGSPMELTTTEFNFLQILLQAGDRVVSKDELSERGLGRAREPYDRSVDVHMSHLRRKFAEAAGDAVTIETVRGIGYRVQR
ncbi:MAG: response regulator transcription factor [Desulfovibrionaceae bacterium]|nr:response regulator transcription factor [Desulfovibrionaceae bacterium]